MFHCQPINHKLCKESRRKVQLHYSICHPFLSVHHLHWSHNPTLVVAKGCTLGAVAAVVTTRQPGSWKVTAKGIGTCMGIFDCILGWADVIGIGKGLDMLVES